MNLGKYAKAIVALLGGAAAWAVNNIQATDAGLTITLTPEHIGISGAGIVAVAALVYQVANKPAEPAE